MLLPYNPVDVFVKHFLIELHVAKWDNFSTTENFLAFISQ